MTVEIRKLCKGKSKMHADALALVGFLMDNGGKVRMTNADIAHKLGFTTRRGSIVEIDRGRFHRARNHVKDGVSKDGKACCGYRLHYREGGKSGTQYALIDPQGGIGEHATASLESVRGWQTRERQHHTENLRMIVQFEALGDMALTGGDKPGYHVCQKAIIEMEEFGTLKPTTMADLQAWVDSLA